MNKKANTNFLITKETVLSIHSFKPENHNLPESCSHTITK